MDFNKQVQSAFQELLPPTLADGGGAVLEAVDRKQRSIVVRLIGSCLFCPSIKLSAVNFINGFTSANIHNLCSVKIVAGNYTIAEWKENGQVRTSVMSDVIANTPQVLEHEQTSLTELKIKFRIFKRE